MAEENVPTDSGVIVAKPTWGHRLKIGGVGILFVLLGGWFMYDGLVSYPRENAKNEMEAPGSKPPRSDLDMNIQVTLGGISPILGLAFLGRIAWRSRGTYRLEGMTIWVPGHGGVPLGAITRIDKRRWDQKGIAVIDYEVEGGATGSFELDDFYFNREATDQIFDKIVAYATDAAAGGAEGAGVRKSTDGTSKGAGRGES